MKGLSPWAAAAGHTFADENLPSLYTAAHNQTTFNVYATNDSLWVLAEWPGGGRIAFRAAYCPHGILAAKQSTDKNGDIIFKLNTVIGDYSINIKFPGDNSPALKYNATLTPHTDLLIPFWPRDIVIPDSSGEPENTA